MFLSAVLTRFFKSFNYDYLRKHHAKAKPLPWEEINGAWFPYVRVPLARDITTVVGANESGKSQLLSAIKKALSGERISRSDFCRYSQFFTVEKDNMRSPDFGLEFSGLEREEQAVLREIAAIEGDAPIPTFVLLRENQAALQVWIRHDDQWASYAIKDPQSLVERNFLPTYFEIDAEVALPDSVPISWLQGAVKQCWTRGVRSRVVRAMDSVHSYLANHETAKAHAPTIANSLVGAFEGYSSQPKKEQGYALARDLLFKVAKVDANAIKDLADALAEENEGLVNGILQQINNRLEAALNFPSWWVQDRLFRLAVTARDDDLVFTIGDRTRTEYSFGECSNGLRYFLSYYVQYLAHEFPTGPQLNIVSATATNGLLGTIGSF